MTKARADQIIVISLFVLLASTVGGRLAEGKKGQEKHYGRKIVGGFLTMFFASLAAEAAPEVGALLALSVASYAFFTDGLPAINKPLETAKGVEGSVKAGGTPPVTGGVQALGPSPTTLTTIGGQLV